MGQRLRSRDLAILAQESPTAPMHNATVEVFDPADSGFDHDRLLELIADRISFVPRYRQRLQSVPGRLANPVWIDDPHFDLAYHVRRSALPRPGTLEQLRDLGNTVIVVEHDEETIRSADHILDLGPRAGRHGGRIVVEGTLADVIGEPASLTGALSWRRPNRCSSAARWTMQS